ncbi:MAG: HAD family phosphatase [Armatimonadota bacterium]|nr:HAD family phosphatase [Armatimonadota bacterium]
MNALQKDLPDAVIFDMDGVLADTEPLHGECFVRAFASFGILTTLEDYRQAVTLGGSTVRDYFLRLGGDPSDWDRVKGLKDSYLEQMIARKDVLTPGTKNLLQVLRSSGIKTAVATSARRRSLDIILTPYGLHEYFDVLVTKDDTGTEKPDPQLYLIAAQKLNVDPQNCVAIEDSPRGIIAAVRAGMRCIAVPTPSTADADFSMADLVVPSLEAIDFEVLRRVMRRERNDKPRS